MYKATGIVDIVAPYPVLPLSTLLEAIIPARVFTPYTAIPTFSAQNPSPSMILNDKDPGCLFRTVPSKVHERLLVASIFSSLFSHSKNP